MTETVLTAHRLRRLSRGAIAYGAVGIVLAVVLVLSELLLAARLDSIVARVSNRLASVATTVEATASALDAAADAAHSFSATVDQVQPTLEEVETTLVELTSTLRDLETNLGTISIIGQQPFSGAAQRIGQVGDRLESLHARIGGLGDSLPDNEAKLTALGDSLTALATQLRSVNAQLGSGEIEEGLSELVGILRIALFLLAAWFAVPAIASLWLGLWLRRALEPG